MKTRFVRPRTGPGVFASLLTLTMFTGCDTGGHDHGHSNPTPALSQTDDHGLETRLGSVMIAERELQLVLLGQVAPGKETAFEVQGVGISITDLAQLNLYLWLEDENGTQLSAPAKGDLEGNKLHFHVTPRMGKGDPHRVVIRLRAQGVDERKALPLSGHGHEHDDGPHHGILASFGGKTSGFLELKLHDDKGDLELWLARDKKISDPFDLPLDAKVEIEFVDIGGRGITLRPRNRVQNEDEAGQPNVRNGRTNYFIYPTETGEDAAWLQGEEFSSIVVVRFEAGGESVQSEEFVLKPHVH